MQIFVEIGPLRAYLKRQIGSGKTLGFVPTMGALHEGHITLVNASRKQNDLTICSIYVNPVQFNNPSDLEKYPRTLERDIEQLKNAGCDILFTPANEEMYNSPGKMTFDFGSLDKILEGEFRPGHFSGVALVVSKLFNIVKPTRAYFGQKDFQQFMVIQKLVNELKFDLELIRVPTVRESDGLAMSSRNARLETEQRRKAVILSESLTRAKSLLLSGESFTLVRKQLEDHFLKENVRLEYFVLADQKTLEILTGADNPQRGVLLIAAYLGEVRLIDNMLMDVSPK